VIDVPTETRRFFFVAAAMLGVEIIYFLNLAGDPPSGWAAYLALIFLSISVPMLVAGCLGAIVGYIKQVKLLLWPGLFFGVLWFIAALFALSKVAALVAALVSLVSYKMLQYQYRDTKRGETGENQ
jgi:hypothetical protein